LWRTVAFLSVGFRVLERTFDPAERIQFSFRVYAHYERLTNDFRKRFDEPAILGRPLSAPQVAILPLQFRPEAVESVAIVL